MSGISLQIIIITLVRLLISCRPLFLLLVFFLFFYHFSNTQNFESLKQGTSERLNKQTNERARGRNWDYRWLLANLMTISTQRPLAIGRVRVASSFVDGNTIIRFQSFRIFFSPSLRTGNEEEMEIKEREYKENEFWKPEWTHEISITLHLMTIYDNEAT